MKRRILSILLGLITVVFLMPTAVAAEGEDYFSYSAKVTPDSLSKAGSVQLSVTLKCADNSAFSMYDVKIIKGSTVLMNMGDLQPSITKTQETPLSVTRDELGKNIPLKITWMEDNARPKEQSFSVLVVAVPSVSMARTLPAGKVKAGEAVSVKYTISNTGVLAVSDLKLVDFGVTVGTLNALDPGATYTFNYGTTASDGMVSKPELTYQSGGKTYSAKLDEAPIQSLDARLSVQLDADNTQVDKGEKVNLRCTITNVGNAAFSDVKVTDNNQKVVFTATSLPVSATRVFTIAQTVDMSSEYVFHVTAKDELGTTHNVDSNKVLISVNEEVKAPQVEMSVTADAIQLTKPGTVNFEIIVQNKGIDPVSGVSVVDGEDKLIKYIPSLVTGSQTVDYAVEVAQTQTFVFYTTLNQGKPNQERLSSQSIQITIAAAEEPIISPVTTPQTTVVLPSPTPVVSSAASRLNVLLIVIVIVVVLLLVALLVLGILVMMERRRKAALQVDDESAGLPPGEEPLLGEKEMPEGDGPDQPAELPPDGYDNPSEEIWDNTQDIPPIFKERPAVKGERPPVVRGERPPVVRGERPEEVKPFNPESFDRQEDIDSGLHGGFLPKMGQRAEKGERKNSNLPEKEYVDDEDTPRDE